MGDLSATLLMDKKDTTVPALPATTNDPAYTAAKGCTQDDLLESGTQPVYPLPAVQQMPSQEAGAHQTT